MRTFAQLDDWCAGAMEQFGDPSTPICQLFFRWQQDLKGYRGNELACGMDDGELVLLLGPGQAFPLPIITGAPKLLGDDVLEAYGAEQITPGVWALEPSFYPEGIIHAFTVLYGVPDPAPWEQRIVLP